MRRSATAWVLLASTAALAAGPPRSDGHDPDRPETRLPEPGQRYYAYGALTVPLVAELDSALLAEPAQAWLKTRGISGLRYTDATGTTQEIKRRQLKELPAAALKAIIDVLKREQAGAESDLLVRTQRGLRTPVSLLWEEGSLAVSVGRPVSLADDNTLTEERIEARWGITLETDEGGRWSGRDLALVDRAFSLLSPEAIACVQEVPLVASGKKAKRIGSGIQIAVYRFGAATHPRIELYQTRTDDMGTTFLGDPRDPVPFDVQLILHELGHAVADARFRRSHAPHVDDLAEAFALQEQLLPYLSDDNRLDLSTPEARALYDRQVTVTAALKEVGLTPDSLDDRWAERQTEHGVVSAWATVMGDQWRPTRYGATNNKEGFAEMFGLVYADHAAMARVLPTTVAWFDDGHHLDCGPPQSP